ncbi:hypothetical protein Tco_1128801 [Tanacetum coccineum]
MHWQHVTLTEVGMAMTAIIQERIVEGQNELLTVFNISNCAVKNQVKFAICTLHGVALTWWKSHVKTVGQDAAHSMP